MHLRGLAAGLLVLAGLSPAAAQPADPNQPARRTRLRAVPAFGGPGSTGADLAEDAAPKEPFFRFEGTARFFEPYFDFKERVNDEHGLAFGGDYALVYQFASESIAKRNALAGMFRFFGSWTPVGRGTSDTGSLVYKVESRHRIGNANTPLALGFDAGSILPTKAPWGDQGWLLTNLFWQQRFADGRLTVLGGQIDVTDYVDVYGLVSPWTGFSNLAFLTNPTIAAPDQGLGAAIGGSLTEHLYVVAGVADANPDPSDPLGGFSTFFGDNEYFTHLELGWTSSWERRYLDNVHVTAWHADARADAGVPGSWGVSFSAAWFVKDRFMPFLRAGWSSGEAPLVNGHVAFGLGFLTRSHDLLAVGLAWSEPSASGLRDQYTFEVFYRLQLTEQLALTPDLQLIVDPALSGDSVVWVPGLRIRLAF